jgi:hypothetical protein
VQASKKSSQLKLIPKEEVSDRLINVFPQIRLNWNSEEYQGYELRFTKLNYGRFLFGGSY